MAWKRLRRTPPPSRSEPPKTPAVLSLYGKTTPRVLSPFVKHRSSVQIRQSAPSCPSSCPKGSIQRDPISQIQPRRGGRRALVTREHLRRAVAGAVRNPRLRSPVRKGDRHRQGRLVDRPHDEANRSGGGLLGGVRDGRDIQPAGSAQGERAASGRANEVAGQMHAREGLGRFHDVRQPGRGAGL